MEEDKMSKQERNALRRQKETLRKAKHGFMKELIDDMEDRPAEVCCLLFFLVLCKLEDYIHKFTGSPVNDGKIRLKNMLDSIVGNPKDM
jgi:hypothetical protein